MQGMLLVLSSGDLTWLTRVGDALDVLSRRLKSHKYLCSVHAQNIVQMHIEDQEGMN